MDKLTEPAIKNDGKKVYKIGFTNNRKDARRHLLRSFRAADDEEAKDLFIEYVSTFCDTKRYFYRLYTGDWKEIYSFES